MRRCHQCGRPIPANGHNLCSVCRLDDSEKIMVIYNKDGKILMYGKYDKKFADMNHEVMLAKKLKQLLNH